MLVGMPTDYARNKPMHTREVRYERSDRERPFSGKRDWHRVAVFERSPSLNTVGAGSYEPPSKRRPSGRHGFSGENGRYSREHSRISEHQPMFGVGYSNFGHKNEQRYVVGGMGHYPNGRNGFKDAEEDTFRDRGLSQERAISSPPSYHLTGQPLHSYNGVFEDGHRGSRYSWESLRQQRPSCSPDVVPERRQVRWDVTDKEYEGRLETRFDDRFDRRIDGRYAAARDPSFPVREPGFPSRDATSFTSRDSVDTLERTHDFGDSFKAHRHQQTQFSFGTSSLREEKASSPRKRTRLGWGQGLAKYEQKKIVEAEPPAEHCRASEATTARSSDSVFESKEGAAHSKAQWCQARTSDTSSRTKDREHIQVQGSEAAANCNHVPEEVTRTAVSSPEAAKQPSEPPLAAEAGDISSPQLAVVTPTVDNNVRGSFVEEAPTSDKAEAVKEDFQSQAEVAKTEKDGSPGIDAYLVRETSVEPASSTGLEGVSKEVALLRVEQLEFQIDSIEKELIRLDVQGLEEVSPPAVDEPSEEKDLELKQEHRKEQERQEETTSDPLVSEDVTADRAAECSEREHSSGDCVAAEPAPAAVADIPPGVMDRLGMEFAHLLPAELSSKLYSSPREAPPWVPNEELHNEIKHRIMQQMLKKRQELKFKEQSLALKYRLLKAIRGEVADEHPKKKGGRTTDVLGRSTEGDADIMEHRQYLKKLLVEPVRPVKERLKMPAMILDDRDKPLQYISSENRLVEDPVNYEQDRKSINPWTPDERRVFLEKFGLFYKNFAKIASYLDHKTVGDCIEYYYRNQKSEEFAKLRKRHKQNKRRQLRSSYMATTSTGRLRESTGAHMHTVASAASSVGRDIGKPSRTTLKVVDQERLSAASDCVTLDAPGKHAAGKAGNLSGSIVTGVCSLSSDAPLTPSRLPCQRTYCREDRQKGGRNTCGRREYGKTPGEDVEAEWSDKDRKLFLDGLLQFGQDFSCISLHVRTKSEWQCKAFFCKTRKRLKLDKILEKHEAAQAMAKQTSHEAAGRSKCRTSENEEMDVSTVVDKEGNGTDAEDTMEDTSAAVPFADSPVSSVITSPGLAPVSPPVVAAKTGEPIGASSGELKQVAEADSNCGQRQRTACVQNCKANQPEFDLSRRCKDDAESCDNKPVAAVESREDPVNGLIHQQQVNGFQPQQQLHHRSMPVQLEQQQQLLQIQAQMPNHLLLHQHYLTSTAMQPATTVKQESQFTTNNQLFLHPQLSEPAACTVTQLQTAAAVTPLAQDRGALENRPFFLLEQQKQQQPQVRQGDVKLFGVPLVSQPATTVATTTTQPSAEPRPEPRPVSWCTGSAESLERRQASLSAAAATGSTAQEWQVHQPELLLWKAAAVGELKPGSSLPSQQQPPPPLSQPSPLQVAAGWGHLGGLACAVQQQQQQQPEQQQQEGSH